MSRGPLTDAIERPDREKLVDGVLSCYIERFPSYAELSPEELDGPMRTSVRATSDLLFALIDGDQRGIEFATGPAQSAVRDRVAMVATADALGAMELGAQMVWEAVLEQAEPEELRPLVASVGRLMSFLAILADVAGHQARKLDETVPRSDRLSRLLLAGLLDSDLDTREAGRMAWALGLEMTERYRAFALAAPGADRERWRAHAAELRRRGVLAVAEEDGVHGLIPEGVVCGWAPAGTASSTTAPLERADLAQHLEGAREIVRAAALAGRTGPVEPGVVMVDRLVASSPEMHRPLVQRVLAPLESGGGRTNLKQTLVTYVEHDFDRRRAAKALHIQPASLGYRLERIEVLTGLSFDRAPDLALLTLACKAKRAAA